MPRLVRAFRLAGLVLAAVFAMFSLALFGLEIGREGGNIASIWLANSALIAFLVRRPQREWHALLPAIFGGNLLAGLVVGDAPLFAAILAACNLAEIALVAGLFSRSFKPTDAFHSLDQIGRLAMLAVAAPLASAMLVAASLAMTGKGLDGAPLLHWLAANVLGIILLTPLLLTWSGPRLGTAAGDRLEFPLLLALGALASFLVFSQTASSLFLITPLLVFAALRLRLDQATALVVLVCAIGLAQTLAGHGPLHSAPLDPSTRIFLLKAFMATVVTLVLPVAALSQERARTAAALRSSEEHYRLLADHGSDIVLRLDGNGQASFVSSAARRLLGLPEQALAGDGLARTIHRDDLPRFRSALDRVRRNGSSVSCFRMRTARGDHRWIEAHCRLAAPAGTDLDPPEGAPPAPALHPSAPAPAIIATLRDVDQRRTAELLAAESAARLREGNRLLLMAENLASLGHWAHDPIAREVFLSPEAAMLADLPQLTISPEELLASVHPKDRRVLLRGVALARRRDHPAECIIRIERRGLQRTLQLRLQQRDTASGSLALFGVVSDITDKLASQRQLVDALEEARAAADFRSQFLATMSHEIRTPMTGVIGMIELLSDEPRAAKRRLYLDTLRRSADLLMTVLNDILDYSKVDAGHLDFADEPFCLGQLLATTMNLFERPAMARGLRLVLDGPLPRSLWVRGDALRLQQVISNLLSNAIKFSERGEVALRCSAQPRAAGRVALRLTVEDRGIGISPALQAKLFEPFVQGGGPGSQGGTGLGLAISRRLIGGMGGSLTLRSVEGRGSAFTIALTLAEAPVPDLALPLPTLDATFPRPLDILLAEDNPVNQLLLTALLKRFGHRVTAASDGQAAVDAARGRRFDCILMDMQMPRLDGRSAAAAIRTGTGPNQATPILALTADAAGRSASGGEGGIDAVLTKPIDSRALQDALLFWTSAAGTGKPAPQEGRRARASATPLDHGTLREVGEAIGPERLDDLLDLLAAELEARPRALRAALADHDLDLALAEAHSLKGAAANLGASRVAAAAAGLEQAIASARRDDRTGVAPALRSLAAAVSDTQHALAGWPRSGQALFSGA